MANEETKDTGSESAADATAGAAPPSAPRESEADSGLDIPPPDLELDLEAITKGLVEEHEKASGVEKPAEKEPEKVETKPGEKPAEEPKPETPKESAFIRAVKAREAKLVEEKTKFRAELQQFEAKVQAIQSDLEKRASAIIERDQLASKDPIAYLAKFHGITEEDIARRILNGGKAAPDEEMRRQAERVERLEAELRKRDEEAKNAQRTAARQAEEREFVTLARDKHPILKAYKSDAALLRDAYDIANQAARRGFSYTNDEIAEYLADLKRAEYNAARELLDGAQAGAASKEAAGQTAPKANENGSGHQGKTAGATAGPTLTNRVAAERASIPRLRVDLDPDEERNLLIEAASKAAMNGV